MSRRYKSTGSNILEDQLRAELQNVHVLQRHVGEHISKGLADSLGTQALTACNCCMELSAVLWTKIANSKDNRQKLDWYFTIAELLTFVCDVQLKQSQAGELWIKGVLIVGFTPQLGILTELNRLRMHEILYG